MTVQDQTRAVIPAAYIRIRSETLRSALEIRTDQNGNAAATLDVGTYKLSVVAPGFKDWIGGVKIEPRHKTTALIELIAGGTGWGPVMFEEKTLDVDRILPPAAISYVPLEIVPLPARKLRQLRHGRSTL